MLGDVNFGAICQTTAAETPISADEDDVESVLLMYQLQAEQFKEDFEHERQDHERTAAQVQSLTSQWNTLYDELRRCQAKVRCGVAIVIIPKPNSGLEKDNNAFSYWMG